MYKILKYSDDEKRILFRNTAQKMDINEAIVEKDYWVCLILDYLFHHCTYANVLTFKGGTSLSKCYGLIKRFSEDVDLILDWRALGYHFEEPWEQRSNTKQDALNKEANQRAETFLKETLLPVIKEDISNVLGKDADLYIMEDDSQTICFRYPRLFQAESILQVIRLEIGALAAWTPSVEKKVTPYVAEYYPKAFEQIDTKILTAAAERTFWEKVTILHHEANRPENIEMPSRYSRHYYDLYSIAHSEYKNMAYENLELLQKVVDFKMKFYPRRWAKYEEAKPGTLKLVPPKYRLEVLKKDYAQMAEMMFGLYPSFEELVEYIMVLEQEMNRL